MSAIGSSSKTANYIGLTSNEMIEMSQAKLEAEAAKGSKQLKKRFTCEAKAR
jgi:hypothetical protein